MPHRPLLLLLCLGALFAAATACSRRDATHPGPAQGGGHAHHAPNGGTLVELGQHQFNLELVHDRPAATLTAYVLDGHAAQAVRIQAPEIRLLVDRQGRSEPLVLRAVANQLSGETVGNTSEFQAQADWLKEATRVSGRIAELTVRGATFRDVPFVLD